MIESPFGLFIVLDALRSQQQKQAGNMIQRKLRNLTFWLCACTLLITGCATSPDSNNDSEQFAAAKDLFIQHEYVQAVYLLEPLAIKGHRSAQYTLGYLYYYGLGITQNTSVATKWITSAAAKGHKKAREALDLIRKERSATKVGPSTKPGIVTPDIKVPSVR